MGCRLIFKPAYSTRSNLTGLILVGSTTHTNPTYGAAQNPLWFTRANSFELTQTEPETLRTRINSDSVDSAPNSIATAEHECFCGCFGFVSRQICVVFEAVFSQFIVQLFQDLALDFQLSSADISSRDLRETLYLGVSNSHLR